MKFLGYCALIIGVLGLIVNIENTKKLIPITIPSALQSSEIMMGSIAIIIIGIVIIKFSSENNRNKGDEVPIYEGKKIIGYRKV